MVNDLRAVLVTRVACECKLHVLFNRLSPMKETQVMGLSVLRRTLLKPPWFVRLSEQRWPVGVKSVGYERGGVLQGMQAR